MTELTIKQSLFRPLALTLLLGAVPAVAFAQSTAPRTAPARTAPATAPARTAPVQAAPAAVPAPPALMTLSQIPGITVQHYNVTGKTIKELNASIAAQRSAGASGKPTPSSANWSIESSIRKATTGNRCKVVGATARLTGTVVLPRLASTEGVPEPVLKQWRNYVAGLEHQQAVALRQPYDRLREVERAAVASSCEGAQAAVNRAVELITAQPAPIVLPAS